MTAMKTAKLQLIASMFIFGTIGVFVRSIPMPSSIVALSRGGIGVLFLLAVIWIKKTSLSPEAIRRNLLWLCLSGAVLGFNWIVLFEAYNYTSVAVATLINYMAPILVILASPIFLREKLSLRKLMCVFVALTGMVCISGVLETGIPSAGEMTGILLGFFSAVLYASIVLMNKQIHDIPVFDKTVVQLAMSALVLIPYCLVTVQPEELLLTPYSCGMLLVVGIVHTGVAYYLYFGSIAHISAQSVAIISYIDPVIAVLASVLILREPMVLLEGIGAVLILGAALFSEVGGAKKAS